MAWDERKRRRNERTFEKAMAMQITRQMVAQRLTAYLQHRLSQRELVDWAERAMQEEDFDPDDLETVRDIVSRLGLADVRAFDLTWEDCEGFLRRLGYTVRVEVEAQT